VIIDGISAHKFNMRRIPSILNSHFSRLRKFGYGFVIICTYATDRRDITLAVQSMRLQMGSEEVIRVRQTMSELL